MYSTSIQRLFADDQIYVITNIFLVMLTAWVYVGWSTTLVRIEVSEQKLDGLP